MYCNGNLYISYTLSNLLSHPNLSIYVFVPKITFCSPKTSKMISIFSITKPPGMYMYMCFFGTKCFQKILWSFISLQFKRFLKILNSFRQIAIFPNNFSWKALDLALFECFLAKSGAFSRKNILENCYFSETIWKIQKRFEL